MNYPTWLLWLAGTLLPLGLLWSLWRLALRPERCYGYNRTLLLLAPALAAALPLLPHPALPTWLASPAASGSSPLAVLLPAATVGTAPAAAVGSGPGWAWLLALYVAGVVLGLGRLAWQTARLWQLAQQLPRLAYDTYTLVRANGQLPTSTFGRVVFWDETTALAPAEVQAVLAHELAHVRQRHTLDVLWLQVWRAVLWPNPFAHLLLPALRLTHELLADRAAAATPTAATATPEPYTTLLARLAARQLAGPAYSLLQPFAFSSTLTRIAMLQSQTPVRRWKQWLVLPTLGGLFLAACQSTPEPALAPPPPPILTDIPQEIIGPNGQKVYAFVEQMPQLSGGGGATAIVQAIQAKIAYPQGAPDGRVFAKFTVAADGSVHDISIVKGLTTATDKAVVNAIKQLPIFEPGRQDGKAVNVSFTVPVQFQTKP